MSAALDAYGNPRRARDGRRLYSCDHCGQLAPWESSWAWHGSYRDVDDGVPVLTMCSNDCRLALCAAGRLPAKGLGDDGSVIEKQPREASA